MNSYVANETSFLVEARTTLTTKWCRWLLNKLKKIRLISYERYITNNFKHSFREKMSEDEVAIKLFGTKWTQMGK